MNAVLSALSTPRRREILRILWDGELAVGRIHAALPDQVSIAAVSEHLGVLARAGLVQSRSEGRFRYYRVDKAALGPLRKGLESMWEASLGRLQLLAELEAARRGPRSRRTPRTRKPRP